MEERQEKGSLMLSNEIIYKDNHLYKDLKQNADRDYVKQPDLISFAKNSGEEIKIKMSDCKNLN